MTHIIKPASPLPFFDFFDTVPSGFVPRSVFLGGSIEMGSAENWQDAITDVLLSVGTLSYIFNPRRDNWDSSWEQSIHNSEFKDQVEWEFHALNISEYIIFYFDPNTKSPITLMELGYHLAKCAHKCLVYCPSGYWRKGNVDVMCKLHHVPVYENRDEFFEFLKQRISSHRAC